MGMYDMVVYRDRECQVKCWDSNMQGYTIGDRVPDVNGESTYVIAVREGGFLLVFKDILIDWDDEIPEESTDWPIFDKWGGSYDPKTANEPMHGLLEHEPYTFKTEGRG